MALQHCSPEAWLVLPRAKHRFSGQGYTVLPDTAMIKSAEGSNQHTVASWRRPIGILLLSVLFLIPCFWQSRIQAGDLSSHVYNAWLASLISQGKVQGLWIAPLSNNVLFDLALECLLPRAGAAAAQRIAVSASVLIFAWGAIAFMSGVGGRNWWLLVPSVAMLAYGFTYHMGFFNFQLSLGICLWYLAIFWRASWRFRFLITPLLALAWLAHPFPVIWALGTAAYLASAQAIQPRLRPALFALGLLAITAVRYILERRYTCIWSAWQGFFSTGTSQILVFNSKYLFVLAGFLLVWLTLLSHLVRQRGLATLLRGTAFQLWLLNAAAVLLIPNVVVFPSYGIPFSYISDRLSLLAGIMLAAVLAAMPVRVHEKVLLIATTTTFFCFLFADTQQLNRTEDQVSVVVGQLPAGARVLGFFPAPPARVNGLLHVIDRACIGHCFSYANYEPPSRQFRIRAGKGNGVVFDDYADIASAELGKYVVQARDLPLYGVYPCGSRLADVCSRPLQVGDVNGVMGARSNGGRAP